MPRVQRNRPMWQQVATHYKDEILAGRLREGDQLPSIRQIREEWDVSQGVAQQAVAHLHLAEKLVRTDPSGTYVAAPRAAIGPQQRLRLAADPEGEDVTVTAAEVVPAPPYIWPMFGLEDGQAVIRREEVTRRGGRPHMLAVTWVAPWHRETAPELLHQVPLPDPRGAAHLVAVRLGLDPAQDLTGGVAFECREAKPDGRELPALGLEPGAFVLAGVYGWRHGPDLIAYTEFILPPGQVVEADIDPA